MSMWKKKKELIARYDSLSNNYDELYGQEQLTKYYLFFRRCDVFFNETGILGDFGCGTGLLIKVLKNKRLFIGVDFSRKSLLKAKEKKHDAAFILADIEFPPFRSNSFETIFMFTVIHHIESPGRFIRRILELVRRRIVISVLKKESTAWIVRDIFNSFSNITTIDSPESKDVIMIIERKKKVINKCRKTYIGYRRVKGMRTSQKYPIKGAKR